MYHIKYGFVNTYFLRRKKFLGLFSFFYQKLLTSLFFVL